MHDAHGAVYARRGGRRPNPAAPNQFANGGDVLLAQGGATGIGSGLFLGQPQAFGFFLGGLLLVLALTAFGQLVEPPLLLFAVALGLLALAAERFEFALAGFLALAALALELPPFLLGLAPGGLVLAAATLGLFLAPALLLPALLLELFLAAAFGCLFLLLAFAFGLTLPLSFGFSFALALERLLALPFGFLFPALLLGFGFPLICTGRLGTGPWSTSVTCTGTGLCSNASQFQVPRTRIRTKPRCTATASPKAARASLIACLRWGESIIQGNIFSADEHG